MQDEKLLQDLLAAENEEAVLDALNSRGLLTDHNRDVGRADACGNRTSVCAAAQKLALESATGLEE